MKYLLASYQIIDAVIYHPESCKPVYVETSHDILALINAHMKDNYWDEEITSTRIDLDKLTVIIKTEDTDGKFTNTRTFYLIPIQRYVG